MVNLTLEPPPSASRPRSSPLLPLLAAAAVALLLAGGAMGFWLGRATAPVTIAAPSPDPAGPGSQPSSLAAAQSTPTTPSTTPATPAPTTPSTVPPTANPAPAAIPTTPSTMTPTAPPATAAAAPGQRRLAVTVTGPLEDSIAAALPREERAIAQELTQVVNRLLVWDLQVARDGRRGDRLEVVWEKPDGKSPVTSSEPIVEAVRYESQKLGRAVEAYRFRADGAPWPRYYRPDGSEVEERLVDGPIRDYDQVTSLLRDGRRHGGVDFRTPQGTAVYAPFDGEIVRRNWNWRSNGNCLEVRDRKSGRRAIFLHLDVLPKDMAAGRQVTKGERIASSGNSGHSFAPHLHYQLEAPDGRVLDPFEVHGTTRIALDAASRPAFQASRARLGNLLGK